MATMRSLQTLFGLTGRTALVTGSSQGIGLALAEGLALAGARIVLNGRDTAKLADAQDRLARSGADVRALTFDVTDADAVRSAVDGFEADAWAIDILVNNAGMQLRGPLETYAAADFDRLIRTNVHSVFHVGQAVARHMIARGAGKIIPTRRPRERSPT